MQQLLRRVAGCDVHRDTVKTCVRIDGSQAEVRTFSMMTADLLALRDWLKTLGVTHVAMESTGVFWKPLFYVLEEEFTVVLVNAAHMKNVPGRKTDVKDCEWIAQLLEHGLLRASFVPPKPIRELRDLTRYRTVLMQERAREVQRVHKVLQDAGVKLSSVATDIMGVSGRAMIEALIEGKTDAEALAHLARGRLRVKIPELRKALEGHFQGHHAFLASHILAHVDYLDESLEQLNQKVEERLLPFSQEAKILRSIPGVADRVASVIISEIGVDMKQFPDSGHLASWAGACPGNNESAGKHKSGKTRKGDRWLGAALNEAALAAIRTRDSYFATLYGRIMRRRGHKKAVRAVAHAILVIAYHLLSRKVTYEDLGTKVFAEQRKEAIQRRCVQQLRRLGYHVTLSPTEAVA